jgi:hypothetical protein
MVPVTHPFAQYAKEGGAPAARISLHKALEFLIAGFAFGDDEGHVVVLFGGAETLDLAYDGRQQVT